MGSLPPDTCSVPHRSVSTTSPSTSKVVSHFTEFSHSRTSSASASPEKVLLFGLSRLSCISMDRIVWIKVCCVKSVLATMTLANSQENAMDALLSVDEAARRLGGLSKYTIHAWLSSGKLRRTKVGSRTMIRESELERVIEDGGKSTVRRG